MVNRETLFYKIGLFLLVRQFRWMALAGICLCLCGPLRADDMARTAFEKLSLVIKTERLKRSDLEELGVSVGDIDIIAKDDDGHEYNKTINADTEGRCYELVFQNQESVFLENVSARFRFFYTIETNHYPDEQIKSEDDSLSFSLLGDQKTSVKTRPFVVRSWKYPSDVYPTDGSPTEQDASPMGV